MNTTTSKNKTKKILIAHQSTIPHYRVDFYNALMKLKPDWWTFTVMYDKKEAKSHFYMNSDESRFKFDVKSSKSFAINIINRRLIFQTFPFTEWGYDLFVVGGAMNNISYPISIYRRIFGLPVAYWGHSRFMFATEKSSLKTITESIKFWLARRASGFFSYTFGGKEFLISQGVSPAKIFPLYNTINIVEERKKFDQIKKHRDKLRKEMGYDKKKVLLYVGRFNKEKKLDVLVDSFRKLYSKDQSYRLLIIGGGDSTIFNGLKGYFEDNIVKIAGIISEEKISAFYIVSDVFVLPGAVGLAPLQAMCYNLIPIVIDSEVHSPEYEYLNEDNSVITPIGANSEKYANCTHQLFNDSTRFDDLKNKVWSSIQHLTIENMASNFIKGINIIIKKS